MLQGEDQIAIADTFLVYREAAAERESDARDVVLQACSFLFLFRALAAARDERQRSAFEEQLAGLISSMVPCSGAVIFLPRGEEQLRLPELDPASLTTIPLWAHSK